MTAPIDSANKRKRIMTISSLGRFGALLLLVIIGSLVSDVFLSARNLNLILINATVLTILGVGQTITIITKGPDLSAGSILTICAVVASILSKNIGVYHLWAFTAAIVLGMFLGYLNGFMVAIIGIPSFISTYGLQWAVFGFAYVILRGYVIYDFDPAFRFIGNGYILGVSMPIVIMVLVVIAGILVLRYTTLGRRFFSVGANSVTSKMSGINIERTIIYAFVISGALAALGGIVLVARINAVQADIGRPYLLMTIATVFMGGTSPTGGQGSIIGTVIGAMVITIVVNLMNLLAVPSEWRDAIIGLLILITVLVDIMVKKKMARS